MFRLRPLDRQDPVLCKRLFLRGLPDGERTGLEMSERVGNQLIGLLEIQIADNGQRHVPRHIVALEKGHDILHRRILQMLGQPDDGPSPGVGRQYGAVQHLVRNHRILVLASVELLIHRFQLRMEQAEHRTGKPFRIQRQIFPEFVGRNFSHIDREIISGRRIESGGPDRGRQLGKLSGGRILCRLAGEAVDLGIERLLPLRILLSLSLFKQIGDPVEKRFFLFPVQRPHPRRSLEHHVLEIVGKSGGGGGFVGGPRPDNRQHRDPRPRRIPGKKHGQPVGQPVDPRIKRIVRNIAIQIPRGIFGSFHFSGSRSQRRSDQSNKRCGQKNSSHERSLSEKMTVFFI